MSVETQYQIDTLCNAIVADINEMSNEQILEETAGEDAEEVAQGIRELLTEIVLHHKHKARL